MSAPASTATLAKKFRGAGLVGLALTAVGLAFIYLADRSGRDRYLAPSGP